MTAVDVVGAVGGEDDEAAGAQGAEEIGEQMAGGGVGPVQVLQDEDDGVLGGDPFQQPGGELEEAGHAVFVAAGLAGGGDGEFGQQPGQFLLLAVGGGRELVGQRAAQLAQGRGEGGEGQAVGADLHASAEGDDPAPVADDGGELLDQAGLPHPGLAADQQRLGFTGAARPNASIRVASSPVRPTNTGLTDLVSTPPSIARARCGGAAVFVSRRTGTALPSLWPFPSPASPPAVCAATTGRQPPACGRRPWAVLMRSGRTRTGAGYGSRARRRVRRLPGGRRGGPVPPRVPGAPPRPGGPARRGGAGAARSRT